MRLFVHSPGGLTTRLWSYLYRSRADASRQLDFLWVGWPGINVATELQAAVREFGQSHFNAVPVFLEEESMDRFYHVSWPLTTRAARPLRDVKLGQLLDFDYLNVMATLSSAESPCSRIETSHDGIHRKPA
jgi:hypothetical protein